MGEFREADGWVEMLGRSNEMRNALQAVVDAAAQDAKGIARKEAYKTGDFMNGIQGQVVGDNSGHLKGQVQETDWKSKWIEFGTVKQSPRPILRAVASEIGPFTQGDPVKVQAHRNKNAAARAWSKAHPKNASTEK